MYVRGILAAEIPHRRERREQGFTWASSLLVAIIGGTLALTKEVALGVCQRAAVSVAIILLFADAAGWIWFHWKREQVAGNEIKNYNEALSIPLHVDEASKHRMDWWHLGVLAALMALGLGVVVVPSCVLAPGKEGIQKGVAKPASSFPANTRWQSR